MFGFNDIGWLPSLNIVFGNRRFFNVGNGRHSLLGLPIDGRVVRNILRVAPAGRLWTARHVNQYHNIIVRYCPSAYIQDSSFMHL